jgi:hypothetical protein
MKEGLIHPTKTFPAHDQAAEIPEPGEGAFDFPAPSVAPQLPPVLQRGFDAVAPMGTDQLNAAPGQALTQRVRVTSFVIDHALRVLARPPWATAGHGNGVQGGFQQGHLGWGRRFQEVSQRNTLAVDHHHPLRAFPPLGLADLRPPFFAGAKLPSAKASAQASWPWASSWARKARQALSQMPCSSQSRRRRQQVLGDGYCGGKSFHRAPVRNSHKMPSKQGRLGVGVGPPRGDGVGSGNKGAILSHCSSVSSESCRLITGTPGQGYPNSSGSESPSLTDREL